MKNIWNEVANSYGTIGKDYWTEFGEILIEEIKVKEKANILDIGFGRGATIKAVLKQVGESAKIFGVDTSSEMVKLLNKELKTHKNVELKEMNANDLDFDKNTFDYIICGFGLPYIIHGDMKLEKIKKLLKANGKVGFTTWMDVEDLNWRGEVVNKYLKEFSKKQEEPTKEPEKTLAKRIKNTLTKEGMEENLKELGFEEISVEEKSVYVEYNSAEEFWQEQQTHAVKNILNMIEAENKMEEFKKDFLKEAKKRMEDGVLKVQMKAVVSCATLKK